MKKILTCFLIIIFLIPMFIFSSVDASSKTLGQLLDELDVLEKSLTDVSDEKKLTEEKLNEITNNIVNIGLEMQKIENTIIEIQAEVDNANITINEKQKEIKKLVSLNQRNNSENLYLELVFGAETLTDFIYRTKAIEQITAYNKKLVEDLNNLIEKNKQKEVDLNEQREKLQKQNDELLKEQQELGSKLNILDEDARDLLEDIGAARSVIANYQKMGCSLNDTLESCSVIPSDSAFLRPLVNGVITSGYGVRDNPVSGGYQFHAAIDIGGNPTGTSVYAAASGIVVLAYYTPNPQIPKSSCGGNFVVIQHQINGKYYATRYMHLSKIYVTANQKVTQNDIIGAVGGGEAYDRCSTGAHLDFSIGNGIYGRDFYIFHQPYTINPYTLINLPNRGVYFTGRYTRY